MEGLRDPLRWLYTDPIINHLKNDGGLCSAKNLKKCLHQNSRFF